MALIDFTRFGIREEDILEKRFSYVIGFDLGHGEIEASYWNLSETSVQPVDLALTKGGATKIISALFRKKNGCYITGRAEEIALPSVVGSLFTCFKVKPQRLDMPELYEGTNVTKRELMQEMLRNALSGIKDSNTSKDFNGKGILAVGCPSSPEWTSRKRIVRYAQILSEGAKKCGLDLVVIVIPESRASLLKVYKETQNTDDFQAFIAQFHKGVIVVDNGSSTSDVTAIDFDTNTMHERSIPLGGAMVEEAILRLACRRSGYKKEDIMEYEQEKVMLRLSKEKFYDSYKNVRDIVEGTMALGFHRVRFKDGKDESLELTPDFMLEVTHRNRVSYSTDECPLVQGTWAELYRNFLISCKGEWLDVTNNQDFEGIVLLTGGASNMFFIQDIAREVFPHARVILDCEPSYCVSRGLAYAVRTDLEAFRLIHEAKEKIAKAVKDDMPTLKGMIGEALTPVVYSYMKRKLQAWKNDGENLSLEAVMKKINKEFLDDCGQDVSRITRQTFLDYLNREGDKGVKALIVKTVNELFESLFPGRLNERSINKFSISEDEWKTIVEMLSTQDAWNVTDALIDQLDIESTIIRALKNNILIILAIGIPIIIIAGLFDWIFNTKWVDKIDQAFTENRSKVCSKEEREKIYNNLVNKEEQNKKLITASLSASCILPENEQKIADNIVACLEPAIDRAVDNVSLYF